MKIRKTIIICITLLTIAGIFSLAWWTGCFTPYNYFTAKRDIRNGNIQLVSYGLPIPELVKESEIRKKYGFSKSNIGCIVTTDLIRGISKYNDVVESYLNKRNGHNWRLRYKREIDSVRKTVWEK